MTSWMRLTFLVFAILALGAPAALAAEPSVAQPAPGTERPGVEQPGAPIEVAPNAGSVQYVEIDSRPARPSGFWTSTRPAQGGAYRYRLLGIGVVVMFMTLAFMLWVVRRKGRPVEQVD
jgi:hypothetical protein